MSIREEYSPSHFYRNACTAMIWLVALYSGVIQHAVIQIPNGMLMLGVAVLVTYILANSDKPYDYHMALTEESIYMLVFMTYMLITGLFFSPDTNSHISQWITCMEYLFILMVISSLLKNSGTSTFQLILLVEAILLAIFLLRNPVKYHNAIGRYSISQEMNPNGLGMAFVAGIWAVLYKQQTSKLSLIISVALISLFVYCILLTGSRKSLIAACITIIFWLLFCFLPNLKERGFFVGIVTLLFMFIVIIFIGREFLSIFANSKLAERMAALGYESTEGNRADMYRVGYEYFKDNPLFGIGFQGFAHYYMYYSHSTLVEVPVSGGIIGTLLYFSAYFVSIKKTIRLYKKTKGTEELRTEHNSIKMIMILWAVILFYTTCIIHPYQFDSHIMLGMIFGETGYIESKLSVNPIKQAETTGFKKTGGKYIKYE